MTSLLFRLGAPACAVALAVAACASHGPARTPTGARVSCNSDSDCVVTDFAGCCPCCPVEPYAAPKNELASRKNACAGKACSACGDNIECPKIAGRVAGFVARCKEGTCADVPR
jgi:hypothetical protein